MVRLLNSAVMVATGHYDLVRLTQDEFIDAVFAAVDSAGPEGSESVIRSYVGYQQTLDHIHQLTSVVSAQPGEYAGRGRGYPPYLQTGVPGSGPRQ